MGAYYDEVEIEDMAWDAEKPDYEDIATCPSCSLVIRVIYDPLDFEDEPEDDDDVEESGEEEDKSDDDSDDDEAFVQALEDLHVTPSIISATA
ncbi:hypothetical protein ONZ45_g12498 [Pleurotus djamor]|nr:hypothetical protein ONZ45_g12498 [Pleurotus djamor]